jgi:hypothetical protein
MGQCPGQEQHQAKKGDGGESLDACHRSTDQSDAGLDRHDQRRH